MSVTFPRDAVSGCPICLKHQSFIEQPELIVFEQDGFIVSHFPVVTDEPASEGRLLIEPRRHITEFSDLNSKEAAALGPTISEAERRLKSSLGAEHVYLFRINDKVKHLHFHLLPRFADTPKEFYGLNVLKWTRGRPLNLDAIHAVVARLKKVN